MSASLERLGPLVVGVIVLAAPFTGLLPGYWITLLDYIGMASLVALGLVLLTGVGGMTSFGQAAFVGFGAYTSAILTLNFGWSPWLTLPVAVVVTAVAALFIGAVTVRLSGHYVPLGTIAWGISISYVFGNTEWLGGHDGLPGIPAVAVGGYALTDPRDFFVLVFAVVATTLLATRNLLDSRIGRAIRILRRGPTTADAFGVDTARMKLLVFVYAAVLAGLSGWLYAHFQRSVSASAFGINSGTEYLLMAVVGGSGRIWGAVLGAAVVTILNDQVQNLIPLLFGAAGNYESIVFGAILVIILQVAPRGVWPLVAGPIAPPRAEPPPEGAALPRRTQAERGTALLAVDAVRKTYGGLVAVNDVSFEAEAGQIIGLIGPNGAGKSTTFNLLTGVTGIDAGRIAFRGALMRRIHVQQIARLGIGRTFQHVKLLGEMSALENVALGAHVRGRAGFLRAVGRLDRTEEALILADARRQLDRVGLGGQALVPAGSLSLGQQRLTEIARALCVDPVLLLLDEPAAGLRVGEKKALAALLRELRGDGVTIILVEHDMDFVMGLADRLVVLDFGVKISEGLPVEVRKDPKVVEAYLGGVV